VGTISFWHRFSAMQKGASMKISPNAFHFIRRSMGVALVAVVCGQALTVGAQERSEKQLRFEADAQACRSGKTGQEFDACMKEAKAVLAAPVGSTPSVSAEQRKDSASLRCEVLTGDEHTACIARMHGEGTVSGSVAGGGILREIVTTEVVPPDAKAPTTVGTGN
jgi:hypothetical protein